MSSQSEDHGIFYDVFPSVLGGGSPCACCFPSALLTWFFVAFLCIHIICSFLQSILPFALAKRVLTYVTYGVHAVLGVIAVFFGFLIQNNKFRDWIFYQFAMLVIIKDKPTDAARCQHFANLSGRVLELGPGPGSNFRCWSNLETHNITEWVGVEPNLQFLSALTTEKQKRNITFPTRYVWLRGEDVDVNPESFDYVIGSHVLCSVTDTRQVLQQVRRALKPGGVYYFYEHVLAASDLELTSSGNNKQYINENNYRTNGNHIDIKSTNIDRNVNTNTDNKINYNYWMQVSIQPLLYFIGNGCQFKRLWQDLSSETGLKGFDVHLRHENVNIGLPFLAPHVIGKATKL